MTLKFSVCVLPLLALVSLPLLTEAAKDCSAAPNQTCEACADGSDCMWCFLELFKTEIKGKGIGLGLTSVTSTRKDTGLGVCLAKSEKCPTVAYGFPTLSNFFPYLDTTGAKHVLEIIKIGNKNECSSSTMAPGADKTKFSPLAADLAKMECKDCGTPQIWCQFDQYLDRTAKPPKLLFKSGGVCLHTGTTYSTDCGKFKAMMDSKDAGLTIAAVAAVACPAADPTCTSFNNCQGCMAKRCTYCGTVLKTTITGGITTYKSKDLGVCKPFGDDCATVKFGTLAESTDYTVGDPVTTTNVAVYSMEVKPFGTYFEEPNGPKLGDCKATVVDENVVSTSHNTCSLCTAKAEFKWCRVAVSRPNFTVKAGFCSATSASTVCTDFTQSPSTGPPAVYAVDAKDRSTCVACHPYTKCSDCVGDITCDWCAADVGTPTKLGYCTKKGTPCDATNFGTLLELVKAAGIQSFTVGPKIACPTQKDSPLVSVSKTCDSCTTPAGNTWCRLDYEKLSGGVCLKTGPTYSTDCASLKTILAMGVGTPVTEAAKCKVKDGAVQNCLRLGLLFAGVALSLLSSF